METTTRQLKHSTAALRPPLNIWEIRFCQLMVEGSTRYEAYTQAGFPAKPSRGAAERAASRLLDRVEIREYLRFLIQEALDAAKVTANRVIQALARLAFADRRLLYDDKGCLLPPSEWPVEAAATVETIETVEVFQDSPPIQGEVPEKVLRGYVRKVKTARRGDALRLLARYVHLDAPAADPGPGPLVVTGEYVPDGPRAVEVSGTGS